MTHNIEVCKRIGTYQATDTVRARDVLGRSNNRSDCNSEKWNEKLALKRVTAFGVVGNGIGYSGGYTGLDVIFAPEYPAFAVMPFVEAQGLFIFDNTWVANLGVGGRFFSNRIAGMFGFNAFYGFRQGHQGLYHQLGLGVELIGKRWGINGNGYIPLGNTQHVKKYVFDDYIGSYKAVQKKKEGGMYGGNVALSLLAAQSGSFMLYAMGGSYFLAGKSDQPQVWGGQLSIQPQFGDYFALSFIITHDNFYGTLYQGGFVFSLPLYKFTKLKKSKGVKNRQIYQPVERMVVIPLEERSCWNCNF